MPCLEVKETMSNSRNNGGTWLAIAGFAALTAAITAALIHGPTRKRIKNSLQDSIDATDRKLDDLEKQAARLAERAEEGMDKAKAVTIKELKSRLTQLQDKLEELS